MRFIAALLGFALCLGTASAQDATTFRHGVVEFSFPGWVAVERPQRPNREMRTLVSVQPADNGEPQRRCELGMHERPGETYTQDQLNVALREAAENLPPDRSITRREMVMVDGVAMLEEDTLSQDGRFEVRSRTRHFVVAGGDHSTTYLLTCVVVNERRFGAATDIDPIMSSVHISSTSTP